MPPPQILTLLSVHSNARPGLLLNALSPAAPSNHACFSQVRSRFVNARLMCSKTKSMRKP